jgi:folate-binding protein YgfZ
MLRPGAAVGKKSSIEVEYIPYGVSDEQGQPTCEVVGTYGDVEPEYAAVRRGAGLFDSPHRGTLLVTGQDRRDFLNRMLTQELKDLGPGMTRQAFWLNRKGRIEADLMVVELGDRMFIDLDIHQAASTVKTLGDFLFAEDVELKDVSAQFHHVAVQGKRAAEVIAAASGRAEFTLDVGQARTVVIDGIEVVVARRDQLGEMGFELIVPMGGAPLVWEFLVAADHPVGQDKRRVRPIGWYAYNIARIEAGTPLFNVDFGSTNLPHETGILRQRVSFTKGCYLGQEIVARMESLGKPKQVLVGLNIADDHLPVAGAQVFARREDGSMGDEVGVVTSSTLSPMLSAAPIAFAMVKTAQARMGSVVLVNAEGEQAPATIAPLRFWPPLEPSASGARPA